MNIRNLFTIILTALMFQACGTNNSKEAYKVIEIAAFKKVEYFSFLHTYNTCLNIREENEILFSANCNTINNFDYEWGYTYKLKVKETKLDSVPEDTYPTRIDLISLESKKEMDINSIFNYQIYLFDYTIELKNSKYYFYNKEFTCDENIECSNLSDIVSQENKYLLNFEYLGDSKIKLKYFELISN